MYIILFLLVQDNWYVFPFCAWLGLLLQLKSVLEGKLFVTEMRSLKVLWSSWGLFCSLFLFLLCYFSANEAHSSLQWSLWWLLFIFRASSWRLNLLRQQHGPTLSFLLGIIYFLNLENMLWTFMKRTFYKLFDQIYVASFTCWKRKIQKGV